jgi:hypothetical protein
MILFPGFQQVNKMPVAEVLKIKTLRICISTYNKFILSIKKRAIFVLSYTIVLAC